MAITGSGTKCKSDLFKSRKKEEDGGEGKDIMQQRAKAGLYKGANERRAVRTRRV